MLGSLEISSEVGGGGGVASSQQHFADLHYGAHYTCAEPGLLHSCSVCSQLLFSMHKGDSSHFAYFYIELHYGAVCQTETFNANLICSAGGTIQFLTTGLHYLG